MSRRRPVGLAALLTAMTLLFAACGGARPSANPPAGAKKPAVTVLYAGSLVNLMEHGLGPAFTKAGGFRFQGFAAGSKALAHQIQGRLRRGDAFVSASPAVDRGLMGKANGDWVRWYATFATAPLVIGYNPHSRFAAALKSKPWYQVMEEPGFRLGRTDPKLDPKGKLTVELVDAAAAYYHQPDLARRVLGTAENAHQVFPETELIGRLQSGQLDAGFFYANEAAEAHIPTVAPPAAIARGATYTVTVLQRAPDPAGAAAFVKFLLGADGQAILKQHGLTVGTPRLHGDAATVPAALKPLLGGG